MLLWACNQPLLDKYHIKERKVLMITRTFNSNGAKVLFAAVSCLLILSACGSNSSAGAAKKAGGTVGFVLHSGTDPNQVGYAKGVEAALAKSDYTVKVVDSNTSAESAVTLIKQLVGERVKAIVVGVYDPVALQAGLSAAKAANIPVYGWLIYGKPAGFAGVSSQTGATEQTNRMVKDLGGNGSVLAFTFHPGQPCVIAEGVFDSIMGPLTDVKVKKVEVPAPAWAQAGDRATSAWLLSHPEGSGPLAIWGCWDGPNIGAIAALRRAGRTDVKVYGDNGQADAIALIRDKLYTATYYFDPAAGGKDLAGLILKNAGKSVSDIVPVYIQDKPIEVDQANVLEFVQSHPGAITPSS